MNRYKHECIHFNITPHLNKISINFSSHKSNFIKEKRIYLNKLETKK